MRDYSIYINDCQDFQLLLHINGENVAKDAASQISKNLQKKVEVMDKIDSDTVAIFRDGQELELHKQFFSVEVVN